MANIVCSGALAETAGVVGPSASGFNKNMRFKGARVISDTGDGVMKVYAGADATGTMIAQLATSDEKQSDEVMFAADDQIPCNAGVFYVISGGGTVVGFLYRVA